MREPNNRFTPKQSHLIRKEILIARAATERHNILEARAHLHTAFSHFGWLKALTSFFTSQGPRRSMGFLEAIFPRYPLVSRLVPLLLGIPAGRTVLKRAGVPVKAITVVVVTIKVWRLWRRFVSSRRVSARH